MIFENLPSTNTPLNATNLNNAINGIVLYSHSTGTTGQVTLSDNVSNYDYLEIYGYRLARHFSVKINNPENDDVFSFIHSNFLNNNLYIYSQVNTLSNDKITRGAEVIAYFSNGSTANVASGGTANTYIDKVVGYKL